MDVLAAGTSRLVPRRAVVGRDRPDFGCRATEAAPDGVAFVMVNGDGLHDALGAMARAGFVRVGTVTWDRRYPGLGGGLRHQTEFVLVGLLPGSRP